MLTMPQIYSRTDFRRKESAKYVRLVYQKRGWDSRGLGFVACKSYSTKEWDPYKQKYVPNPRIKNRYVTVIVFLDQRLHVDVGCSCADFRYRWEFSLNQKRAAEILYSNGEYPEIRNPGLKIKTCKHLVKLWETILPEVPKIKSNAKSDDTYAPTVKIPPSILKKQEEERMKKQAQKSTPMVPPKVTYPNQPKVGKHSPGMSNWIFGG